jgi:predicted chitinase
MQWRRRLCQWLVLLPVVRTLTFFAKLFDRLFLLHKPLLHNSHFVLYRVVCIRGWCGTGPAYCGTAPAPAPVPAAPTPTTTSSGCSGTRCGTNWSNADSKCGKSCSTNAQCPSGEFCYANVRTSLACCPASAPVPAPVPSPPTGGGGGTITAPAKTLSVADLQAALNKYNSLQGANQQATQTLVNSINTVTKNYSLYRQLAFVAQTIWESGGYKYNEEIAATTPPYSTRSSYQICDWNTGAVATNGKFFYGRGYLQLSWCANYKAYGKARMINNDADYFYKNPDLVATLPYSIDSAAWYFETIVKDNSGRFGLTTKDINGPIECIGANNYVGSKPQKRYQIFVALAIQVGLTGYSEGGCYN